MRSRRPCSSLTRTPRRRSTLSPTGCRWERSAAWECSSRASSPRRAITPTFSAATESAFRCCGNLRLTLPGVDMPALRALATARVERLEKRRQVAHDVLHVDLDAVHARPALRAVPLERVVHVARADLLHHQADRAGRALRRVPVMARQEHDLALLHRDLGRTAILDDVEDDVSPQLEEKLLVRIVVIVRALVGPTDDLHDQVLGGRKDELVAHRRLEQVRVLVDPPGKVECLEGHGRDSSGAPKELAGRPIKVAGSTVGLTVPMCGIAGFFALTPRPLAPRGVLERMVEAVRHRGPDDAGVYLDGRAGLGHRRLSIIDLAGGKQPLSTADGELWVTFNGEIFNYVELTAELGSRGCVFRTRSDTETILHAYAEYGPDCVQKFNGDFAYAIWDRPRKRLVIARDRMGVRPLYYTVHDGVLVFASELKSLFHYPGLRAELDPLGLDQCFTFWSPLAPRTAFKDVHELPPGHQLIAEDGAVKVQPYWQLRFPAGREHAIANDAEAGEQVEALLADATRIRMRADVPVGAYLSGGFDSSVTTALAQRHHGALRTFSL